MVRAYETDTAQHSGSDRNGRRVRFAPDRNSRTESVRDSYMGRHRAWQDATAESHHVDIWQSEQHADRKVAELHRKQLDAASQLAAEGIDARVINIHTIKPIDKEIIVKAAKETGFIVTAEEHSVIGGLYSAVCEVVAQEAPCKVVPVAVMDTFGKSGPAAELLEVFNLNKETIIEKVLENI